MAKLTPSVVVGNMSGKLAGSVLLNGVGSLSIRNRGKRRRKQTSRQQLISGSITALSRLWKTLSSAQRTNWNAAAGSYPINDRLSQVIFPTGFALFCGINTARRVANIDYTTDTPVPQFLPVLIDAFTVVTTSSFEITLIFDSAPVNFRAMFFASRPVSQGVSSFSTSDVVHIRSEVLALNATYNLKVFYELIHGPLSNKAGQKIAVEVWALSEQCDRQVLIFSDQVIIT